MMSLYSLSMQRLESLAGQLAKNNIAHSDDDVVICAALRTPLTKAKKGGLKDTLPEVMLAAALKGVVDQAKLDPKKVQDIVVGNVLQPGAGSNSSRWGEFLAGFPETTTLMAVNRQCSSGLEAVMTVVGKIKAGIIDIGIGAGVESMSLYDMQATVDPEKIAEDVFEHEKARNCLVPMGVTSENVAEKFGITKETQNQFAYESHQKAYKAQQAGLFKGNAEFTQTR